jgi:hypothetical protein
MKMNTYAAQINTNNLTSLRNTTSLVAETTVKNHTIEMRAERDNAFSRHYLIIDGEWDMTHRRSRTIAQREYNDTVDFWQTTDL